MLADERRAESSSRKIQHSSRRIDQADGFSFAIKLYSKWLWQKHSHKCIKCTRAHIHAGRLAQQLTVDGIDGCSYGCLQGVSVLVRLVCGSERAFGDKSERVAGPLAEFMFVDWLLKSHKSNCHCVSPLIRPDPIRSGSDELSLISALAE